MEKAKIDIISGFLGVGKTTFANMLLHYYLNAGFRPVYIVNEFGETGLDAEIVRADGFEAVDIFGGCICCTLKDDIAVAIREIMDSFSPTHIVFEPSGAFVFDNFFDMLKEPRIDGRCEIQSVTTIVDSVNFAFSKVLYGSFLYNQIRNSPVILFSKLEKSGADLDELICDVKNINPDAYVISKVWSDWDGSDFELLLGRQQKEVHTTHRARHHGRLQSVTAKPEMGFTQDGLDRFLACCKSGAFGELCRVKGIVKLENRQMLLNIAMQDVALGAFEGTAEPSLTFIGHTVDKKEIFDFLYNHNIIQGGNRA